MQELFYRKYSYVKLTVDNLQKIFRLEFNLKFTEIFKINFFQFFCRYFLEKYVFHNLMKKKIF